MDTTEQREIQVGDQVRSFHCSRCTTEEERPVMTVTHLRREYGHLVVLMAVPGTIHYHTSTPAWAVAHRDEEV